jgi:hypothetical protein
MVIEVKTGYRESEINVGVRTRIKGKSGGRYKEIPFEAQSGSRIKTHANVESRMLLSMEIGVRFMVQVIISVFRTT